MKLILTNREQLGKLGAYLVSEFDSIISRIRGAWSVEHKDDDTHGHVHSDSIATGRLTFADIVTDTITAGSQLDNYSPAGLDTAALLRVNTTLPTVDITGIKVPQDAAGNVIDGRVLVIENVSLNTPFRIFNEHTSSLQRNRVILPWAPAGTETALQWFHLMPNSTTILIYNATKARWVLQGQTNDAIRMTATFSANQADYNPSGFRSSKYVSLGATAAGLSISGFDARTTSGLGVAPGVTNVPYPSTKIITNDGLYEFDILHMSTSSSTECRVACPGSIRYRLHPRESVTIYRSDASTWKIAEKADQWIDVTFSAGNFTTDTGTWTVASGDQATYQYHLDGNKMTVTVRINSSSVATSPTQLRIAVPLAKTIARDAIVPVVAINAGAQISTALAVAATGNTFIQVFRDTAATAWSNATDTTAIWGQITFMVRDDCAAISESHSDVAHGDTAHADVEHSDVAHSDVAHGDSHSDASHSDIAHGDVSHSDVSHSDTPHTDVAHSDSHGDCNTHNDVIHSDSPHDDAHSDQIIHFDSGEPSAPDHVDSNSHSDSHTDISHGDVSHADEHCDQNSHSDTGHSDVSHVDVAHSDTAHADSAHVDTGHTDSHSDTAPHSDVSHVDVSHSDTAHSDSAHADVGYHCDTAHADI